MAFWTRAFSKFVLSFMLRDILIICKSLSFLYLSKAILSQTSTNTAKTNQWITISIIYFSSSYPIGVYKMKMKKTID